MPRVSAVRRRGVSHAGARTTSHARTPVAPAPAAIAPAMHCMHIVGTAPTGRWRSYAADGTPGEELRFSTSSPPTATDAFAVTMW